MKEIDVYKVLEGKNPKLARRVPRFVVDYLRRTIHEREVNEILARFGDLEGIAFVRAALSAYPRCEEPLCARQPVGRTRCADSGESRQTVFFRQGDHVRAL